MNTAIDTVIIIHVPSEWRTTNRRWAFRSLADTLPSHVAVLCVNRPVDFAVTPAKRPRKFLTGIWTSRLEMENGRFGVLTPRIILHEMLAARVPGAAPLNRRLMAAQLRHALEAAYPGARKFIQWIHHPNQQWVYAAIPGCGTVYHVYDEYTCTSDGVFHPERWQRELVLLREADLTFATSQPLLERRSPSARRIHILPNGVPDFYFKPERAPSDPIDTIPPPRILYIGSMYPFLDYAMLQAVFARRSDWQLVMIGRWRDLPAARSLRALENVTFTGVRPQEDVPGIMDRFAVALMPFQINQYSTPATPLKLYMYLSAGLPVISSRLPELRSLGGLIRLVDCNAAAFEQAIEDSLNDDLAIVGPKLKAEARRHAWSAVNRESVIPVLSEVFGF